MNYKPELRPIFIEGREGFLPKENPPASTLVGVTALAREEFLIKVEAHRSRGMMFNHKATKAQGK